MITSLLSRNKTRTATLNELIDTIITNRDLLFKEGVTNVGGMPFYHFRNDNNDACLSYGAYNLTFERVMDSKIKYRLVFDSIGDKGDIASMYLRKDSVSIQDKVGTFHDVPYSAFDSDVDFFQYTLLNLQYGDISDKHLTKLIKFVQELTNV